MTSKIGIHIVISEIMIQFWFLWLFMAIVVVLVAFTLRQERDDMPRTDI